MADRREFLCGLCGALAASVLPGCASVLAVSVPVQLGRVRLRIPDHPGLAGPDGALRVRPVGASQPVYVLRQPAGEWAAVVPICTHQGCTVDISGRYLVCPCHGSTYDRAGNVLRGPAERVLARLPLTLEGDVIVIDVGGMA